MICNEACLETSFPEDLNRQRCDNKLRTLATVGRNSAELSRCREPNLVAPRCLVCDQPETAGVSALGLRRVLGMGSCQTAGTMFHRFRRAVVRPERERLHGLVEVEEIYLAITDRQLRAADRGASSTLPRSWSFKRQKSLNPAAFSAFGWSVSGTTAPQA